MRPGISGSAKASRSFASRTTSCPACACCSKRSCRTMQEALERAGAARFDLVNPLPPFFTDRAPRPIDEKLWTLTARRPVGEWVFANAAQHAPRVTIRRGVGVDALLIGPSAIDGVPHVAGVRTSDGEELRADLVVDATGRQSRSPQWLMRDRRAAAVRGTGGLRLHVLHALLPRRAAAAGGGRAHAAWVDIAADAAGRQDTWSVTIFLADRRPAAEEPAARGAVDEGRSAPVHSMPTGSRESRSLRSWR